MAKRITKKSSPGRKNKEAKIRRSGKSSVKAEKPLSAGTKKSVAAKKSKGIGAKKIISKITSTKILKTAGKKKSAKQQPGINDNKLDYSLPLADSPWPPVVDTD